MSFQVKSVYFSILLKYNFISWCGFSELWVKEAGSCLTSTLSFSRSDPPHSAAWMGRAGTASAWLRMRTVAYLEEGGARTWSPWVDPSTRYAEDGEGGGVVWHVISREKTHTQKKKRSNPPPLLFILLSPSQKSLRRRDNLSVSSANKMRELIFIN